MSGSKRKTLPVLLCALLAACGGGGGSGADSSPATTSQPAAPASSGGAANGSATTSPAPGSTGNETGSANPAPAGTGTGAGSPAPAGTGGTASGAGDGTQAFKVDEAARFDSPTDIVIGNGGNLYVLDRGNQKIRRIAADGQVSTLPGTYASGITELAADPSGNLFVLDGSDVFRLAADGGKTPVKAYPQSPGSYHPVDIGLDGQGQLYVLMNYRTKYQIERVDLSTGNTETVYALDTVGYVDGMAVNARGDLAIILNAPAAGGTTFERTVYLVPKSAQPAQPDSPGVSTAGIHPGGFDRVAFDAADNLYVADAQSTLLDPQTGLTRISGIRVTKVTPQGTAVTLLNGFPDGSSTPRQITTTVNKTLGIAASTTGDVYLADVFDQAIYKITPSGQVSLVAGKPGEAGSSD